MRWVPLLRRCQCQVLGAMVKSLALTVFQQRGGTVRRSGPTSEGGRGDDEGRPFSPVAGQQGHSLNCLPCTHQSDCDMHLRGYLSLQECSAGRL